MYVLKIKRNNDSNKKIRGFAKVYDNLDIRYTIGLNKFDLAEGFAMKIGDQSVAKVELVDHFTNKIILQDKIDEFQKMFIDVSEIAKRTGETVYITVNTSFADKKIGYTGCFVVNIKLGQNINYDFKINM